MELEIGITCLLLVALTFLATVDMAFGQLSDVGLRRLIAEAEEHPTARSTPFLKEILETGRAFVLRCGGDSNAVVALSVLSASICSNVPTRRFILIALWGLVVGGNLPAVYPALVRFAILKGFATLCPSCGPSIACSCC